MAVTSQILLLFDREKKDTDLYLVHAVVETIVRGAERTIETLQGMAVSWKGLSDEVELSVIGCSPLLSGESQNLPLRKGRTILNFAFNIGDFCRSITSSTYLE